MEHSHAHCCTVEQGMNRGKRHYTAGWLSGIHSLLGGHPSICFHQFVASVFWKLTVFETILLHAHNPAVVVFINMKPN